MLDGVYRLTGGIPVFHAAPAPTTEQLQALLTRIIPRLMGSKRQNIQMELAFMAEGGVKP